MWEVIKLYQLKLWVRIFLISSLFIFHGCSRGDDSVFSIKDYDLEKSKSVSRLIEEHLKEGSGSVSIETFLKDNNITYSYDRFAKRYQGIIRNVSPKAKGDHAIVIHINVDEDKSFKSYEVLDSLD